MRTRLVLPLLAVAAIGAAAVAGRPLVHVAEYRLPDGGVARVRYTGDVAPRLVVVPAAAASPFAAFDRIAAMMDAQADALFGDMARTNLAAAPAAASPAAAPAGVRWTSVSSSSVGGRVCTTEVSTVSRGAGRPPVSTRRVSGDCGGATAPTPAPAPARPAAPAGVPRDSI